MQSLETAAAAEREERGKKLKELDLRSQAYAKLLNWQKDYDQSSRKVCSRDLFKLSDRWMPQTGARCIAGDARD